MTSYSRPGVFVNQSLNALTAANSGASGGAVACFVGAYNIGPVRPTFVPSWQDYVNKFGGFSVANGSPLAYAVFQYFNNGGTGCYVYRVPNTDAAVASLVIGSVEPTQVALNPPAAPVPTTLATGGTVLAGTYKVETTYTDSYGETTPSAFGTVTTTGSTSTITIPSPAAQTGATGWKAYVTQAGGSTYTLQGTTNTIGTPLTLTAPPTSGGANPPVTNTTASSTPLNASLLTFTSNAPGAYGNKLYVEVVPGNPSSASDPTSVFTLNIYQGGTAAANLVEQWPAVSLDPNSPRNLLSMMNAVNGGSAYLTASVNFGAGGYSSGTGASDPAGNSGSPAALTGGADGTTAPALDTAVTTGIAGTGWSSPGLGNLPNQVLNLNIPAAAGSPVTQSVINNVVTWALGQGNVFVVIDAPFGGVPLLSSSAIVSSYSQYLSTGGTVVNPQANAAVYGPWLSIPDPASSVPTATKWVAPGGAVLGVWARSDANSSVAQTPAGTTAQVSAVALETYFTPADLSTLETLQVNPVKLVPGTGFCLFGGRTLATGYPNRYINVSRTLMQFTTDFVNITQFAIFQNNDPLLWQQITNVLTSYLMSAMQNNMLAGTSPETAFSVTCDATTTSAAQAQAGIVNAQVAVALVSPAEFIIINLSQMSSGVSSATVSS